MANADQQPRPHPRPADGRIVLAAGLAQHEWVDEDGRMWVSVAPADVDPGKVWLYPTIGPAPVAEALEAQGWPRDAANRLQVEMARARILTARDIRNPRNAAQVDGMVRRAFSASVQAVIDVMLLSAQTTGGD